MNCTIRKTIQTSPGRVTVTLQRGESVVVDGHTQLRASGDQLLSQDGGLVVKLMVREVS